MALPQVPGASPSASLPVVGQGTAPGAPTPGPTGGVTSPTANRGLDVALLTHMILAAKILTQGLATGADPSGDPARAATKAIGDLTKHTPPGSVNPAIENAALMKLLQKQKQEAPMMAALRSQGQQMPQPGASGGAPPGAGAAPPPSPGAGAPPMPMAA